MHKQSSPQRVNMNIKIYVTYMDTSQNLVLEARVNAEGTARHKV